MLYKFKSRATADVIMLESNGRQVLEIVGKTPGASGIITGNSVRSFTSSAICGFQNKAVAYQLPNRVLALLGAAICGWIRSSSFLVQ